MTPSPGSPTGSAGTRVYENPSALPRAWFATGWRTVPDDSTATAATVARSNTELMRRPIVEGIPPERGSRAAEGATVTIRDGSATNVVLDVTTRVAGLV